MYLINPKYNHLQEIHHDLNASNILYTQREDGGYEFQLIDINRMTFYKSLSKRERLANLRKFCCKPVAYLYLLERYAQLLNTDSDHFQLHSMSLRLIEDMRHNLKVLLRQKLRP